MVKKRPILFLLTAIAFIVASLCIWRPFEQKRPFLRIPIVWSHDHPCVYANIEEKKLLFHLDSGASDCLTINPDILNLIQNKTSLDARTWYDVHGNAYNTPRYVIKEIDIQTFQLLNATATEESPTFLFGGREISRQGPRDRSSEEMETELTNIAGRLGAKALRVLDYWLLDLPNASLVAIRDLEKIKNTPGFSFEGFIEVPLENHSPQIVISIETDFGKKRVALDTGASLSVLSPPSSEYVDHQILKMNRLTIGGTDFGPLQFYLLQLPEVFKIDGILGHDFLNKHAVYLDFKNNRAFIGPSIAHGVGFGSSFCLVTRRV